ncbi:MAG TPA: antibiotic biosynthesis monooxygenase family protein [Steroidobacter sp.]|jgi:quinol monooxygenase YgiN|nr:antibiotic biosynthesis monooxygenase family protein [Steroidobacteraceae bacterium]HLS82664.1 antibiotic biosynthesis monooxygenase family protein [Steroidobacter sp.]
MKYLFEVRIRPGYRAEQYADAWVRASELIQRAPGARGTRLHRKIGDPSVLLAIAEWDSKAARDASHQRDPDVEDIIRAAGQYCDITVLGEFEEPEWVVLPPGRAAERS